MFYILGIVFQAPDQQPTKNWYEGSAHGTKNKSQKSKEIEHYLPLHQCQWTIAAFTNFKGNQAISLHRPQANGSTP